MAWRLWPFERILFKKNKQKKNKLEEFCPSVKGAVDSGMVCFFGDTSRPSQWIYLSSCFLNPGEESSTWRDFLCSQVQDFCVQHAAQTVCLCFSWECAARACLVASDSQYFPLQSRLLPPLWVYQLPGKPSRQLGPCHSQAVCASPCAVWAVIPAFAKQKRIEIFLHLAWAAVSHAPHGPGEAVWQPGLHHRSSGDEPWSFPPNS